MLNRLPKILKCLTLTENALYALNQVKQCHITAEELKISRTKTILYIKHFRKELNATDFRKQHQRNNRHCAHNDHTSTDKTIAGITSNIVISPGQFRSLAKGKMIYLADQFLGVENLT